MNINQFYKLQIDDYKKYLINQEHSPETVKKYVRDISSFFDFLQKNEVLNKESVLRYKKMLLIKYKITSGNSMLVALNGFLSYLGLSSYRVKLFKVQRKTFREKNRELSRAEYIRLVKAAKEQKNERLAMLIQTICSTGIRVSEHKFITVEAVKAGNVLISNKGKIRSIILPKELCKKLLKYCKDNKIISGTVFISRQGNPLNRTNIWNEMKKLCKDANVAREKVFPHNLRHLFAISFYQLEKDIVRLADILGHASINTTRIYTYTTPEEYSRSLSKLRLLI